MVMMLVQCDDEIISSLFTAISSFLIPPMEGSTKILTPHRSGSTEAVRLVRSWPHHFFRQLSDPIPHKPIVHDMAGLLRG